MRSIVSTNHSVLYKFGVINIQKEFYIFIIEQTRPYSVIPTRLNSSLLPKIKSIPLRHIISGIINFTDFHRMLSNNSITDDSFDRLLNEAAPMSRFIVSRSRPIEKNSNTERPRRRTAEEKNLPVKNQSASVIKL